MHPAAHYAPPPVFTSPVCKQGLNERSYPAPNASARPKPKPEGATPCQPQVDNKKAALRGFFYLREPRPQAALAGKPNTRSKVQLKIKE